MRFKITNATEIRQRTALIDRLFPEGIPQRWCPLLTHYDNVGNINRTRINAHIRSIAPFVKGLLAPGSTGDGWEMDDEEALCVLEVVLDSARPIWPVCARWGAYFGRNFQKVKEQIGTIKTELVNWGNDLTHQ